MKVYVPKKSDKRKVIACSREKAEFQSAGWLPVYTNKVVKKKGGKLVCVNV